MRREEDRSVDSPQAVDDAAQPLRLDHVGFAVHGGDGVGARLYPQFLEDPGTLARDRRKQARRIRHHVADHHPPPRDPFARQLLRGALVRAEQQGRDLVDGDPVPFFGHGEVEAPQSRLDVCDGNVPRGLGAGQGRVRVAVDEHPVRTLRLDCGTDAGLHRGSIGGVQLEPVAGLVEAQLVEEDPRERSIPVLARVEHGLVDPGSPQRQRQGCRLDELGPISDHGENTHPPLRYAALPGR